MQIRLCRSLLFCSKSDWHLERCGYGGIVVVVYGGIQSAVEWQNLLHHKLFFVQSILYLFYGAEKNLLPAAMPHITCCKFMSCKVAAVSTVFSRHFWPLDLINQHWFICVVTSHLVCLQQGIGFQSKRPQNNTLLRFYMPNSLGLIVVHFWLFGQICTAVAGLILLAQISCLIAPVGCDCRAV